MMAYNPNFYAVLVELGLSKQRLEVAAFIYSCGEQGCTKADVAKFLKRQPAPDLPALRHATTVIHGIRVALEGSGFALPPAGKGGRGKAGVYRIIEEKTDV